MPSINVAELVGVAESIATGNMPVSKYEAVTAAEQVTVGVVGHFYIDGREDYNPKGPVWELSAEFGTLMSLAENGPTAEGIGYFGSNVEGTGPTAELVAALSAQYTDTFSLAKPAPTASLSGAFGWSLDKKAPVPSVAATLYSESLNLSAKGPFPTIAVSGLLDSLMELAATAPVAKAVGELLEVFSAAGDATAPVGYGLGSLIGGDVMQVAATAPVGYVAYGDSTLDYDGMSLAKNSPVGMMGETLSGGTLRDSELVESGRFDDYILQYSRW